MATLPASAMAGFFHLDHKEVIRVNVQKLDERTQPEYKKFSIDPQITSFEMLQNILARAFEINSDFTISYQTQDSQGADVYLSMLSDWDMDAAFQCASEPFLKLRVHLRHFEELDDWDVIAPIEIPTHRLSGLSGKASLFGTITHNLGNTVDSMQRAIGLKNAENEGARTIKTHMTESEFCNYLDSDGFMIQPDEFRLSVYQGGIEPSLRRVAWRHLLNIYPAHLSRQDRLKYLKQKEEEYYRLRNKWRIRFSSNTAAEDMKHVICMVKRDVLRTDRSHDFYAGNDENANTLSLFHILVTYALTHPDVSYCQGMSDLASPLLVTQKNEGQAYICFCALMERLRENFTPEGSAIMTKFNHLSELLCLYDPVLYTHLQQNSAEGMFFCYRWFLLELKREFPLNDALRVLEVMWATLPARSPETELALVDPDYSNQLLSTSPCSPTVSFQHAINAKLLALRQFGTHAQTTKTITSPAQKASVNNNFSAEPSPHNSNPSTSPSIISSLNSSPGEQEERAVEFPVVDNSVSFLVQQSSDNIDRSLHQGLWENSDDNMQDNNSDHESALFNCPNGDVTDDRLWTSPRSYYSSGNRNSAFDAGHRNSCPSFFDFYHVMPNEQGSAICNTDFMSELNTDRQCVNPMASEVLEIDNLQTQFTLSLDSNHYTDSSSVTINNHASSTGCSEAESNKDNNRSIKPELQNMTFSRVEPNHSLFKSVKQLLTAPWQQPSSSIGHEAKALSTSSPRRPSSLTNQLLSLKRVCLAGTQRTGLTKNMSDSHISDCQEATEDFGDSDSTSSSLTNHVLKDPSQLPPPHELGVGNPFLMFMCVSLLIQQRTAVLTQEMCYEEIAMHFDRLVRKHNATNALHLARQMYTQYLRAQRTKGKASNGDDDDEELGLSC